MTGRDGKEMPVTFNRIIRSPVQMRISDFWGILRDGRPLAIECKRRSWTKPTDQREHEQAAFLQMVRDAGGVGIFATCAEDVIKEFNAKLDRAGTTEKDMDAKELVKRMKDFGLKGVSNGSAAPEPSSGD